MPKFGSSTECHGREKEGGQNRGNRAKNASISGGHRMTGDKCTNLQIQVKKVVKSVTAETISVEEKV